MKTFPRVLLGGVLSLTALSLDLRAEAPAVAAAPKKFGYNVLVEIRADEKGHPESVALLSTDDQTTGDVITKMVIAMAAKTDLPPRTDKDGKPVKFKAQAPFFFPVDDDEGPDADLVPKPRVKTAIQPVYPLALRQEGVTGGAILELVVDAEGKLTRLTTLRASHPEFDKAATEAMQKWVFTPALHDGKPVESRTRFGFAFETEDHMGDIKWRVVPRPRLGALVVIRPDHPIQEVVPEEKADEKKPEDKKADAAPSISTPAK